ncbi:hypothetical protein EVAR_43884_1 [Eumeta japonica]|uniref:Uncharacterized protein n=1 Tax=Eumeta variegata TaxID=151549 RepID=A0A4C1WNV8_EUMVA|nr:hypothetical protein EVAR_43884_1 [Eumeta japonica]
MAEIIKRYIQGEITSVAPVIPHRIYVFFAGSLLNRRGPLASPSATAGLISPGRRTSFIILHYYFVAATTRTCSNSGVRQLSAQARRASYPGSVNRSRSQSTLLICRDVGIEGDLMWAANFKVPYPKSADGTLRKTTPSVSSTVGVTARRYDYGPGSGRGNVLSGNVPELRPRP